MVYGYIRVSTDKQTVENQRFEVANFCAKNKLSVNKWIEETVSGTKGVDERKLGNLLGILQKNDILICSELSRLGRNLLMIMSILNFCMEKGIEVWTIKDNYRLGKDISSKVLAFAFGLSAEIERSLISQRTKEAIARRKSEGKPVGRPLGSKSKELKLNAKKSQIKKMLLQNISKTKIAKKLNVNYSTLKRYLQRENLFQKFYFNYMYDILVIGAGIAGLTVALKAEESGKKVLLLTKGAKPDGSTNYAQGGIASVTSAEDSFESHIADTLEAGDGLCKIKAVEILTKNAPNAIEQLVKWGVNFTTAKNEKNFDLHLEGGHSYRRILHAADLTGKEIMRALLARLKQTKSIDFLEKCTVLDLVKNGVITAEYGTIYAKNIVLATGGAGQLWLHSTNPHDACGEGIAMAYRAGAALQDLEFMQFHPTSLYAPKLKKTFLISEALRGFGAFLKNHDGEYFMDKVHPLRSLAPRDIVARAILSEMQRTNKDFMYLDVTHKNAKDIKTHFPNIYAKCLECGIDITKKWIPVVPAAHYMCGGVLVDSFSRTSIDGLYACGEIAATGVHGANRLASNSLLESVVFALRACEDIDKNLLKKKVFHLKNKKSKFNAFKPLNFNKQKKQIQTIMWQHCGIVRSIDGLKEGLQKLNALNGAVDSYEFRNFLESAKLVIESALKRKESRGLQYLTDYPQKNPKLLKHFTLKLNSR